MEHNHKEDIINRNQNGYDDRSCSKDFAAYPERQSRNLARKPRLTKPSDINKIRNDLNDLRERLGYDGTVASGPDENPPDDVMLDELRVIRISDNDVKYVYTEANSNGLSNSDSVKIKVDYRTFEVHKCLLNDSSSYFQNIFERNTGDNKQVIDLGKSVNVNGFVLILDFLYDGAAVITSRTADAILDTAAVLAIKWIIKAASHYALYHIDSNNCITFINIFDKYDMKTEKSEAILITAQKLVSLCQSTVFLKSLPYELLYKILSENYFVEETEGFVVKSILDWIDIDSSRSNCLSELVHLVRFPLLDPEELAGLPQFIVDLPEMKEKIEKALMYVCDVASQCFYTDQEYLNRGSRDAIMFMSATESSNCSVLLIKDLDNIESSMCLENIIPRGLDTKLIYTSQTTLGNFIYIVGGLEQDYTVSKRMFRFDPRLRDWQELANMNTARINCSLTNSHNHLYAIAGKSEDKNGKIYLLKTVEKYDPKSNSWSEILPLPINCYDSASIVVNDILYVSGGKCSKSDKDLSNKFYRCNIRKQTNWEQLSDMPFPRFDHTMISIEDNIYVFGGKYLTKNDVYDECYMVSVYNSTSHNWSTCCPVGLDNCPINKYMAAVDETVIFLADSKWYMYNLVSGEIIQKDYCGPDVQRVIRLKVAFPSVNYL